MFINIYKVIVALCILKNILLFKDISYLKKSYRSKKFGSHTKQFRKSKSELLKIFMCIFCSMQFEMACIEKNVVRVIAPTG